MDLENAITDINNAIQELERDHGSLLAADFQEQIHRSLADLHAARRRLQDYLDRSSA